MMFATQKKRLKNGITADKKNAELILQVCTNLLLYCDTV